MMKTSTLCALGVFLLATLAGHSAQAATIDSGFRTGNWTDAGTLQLDPGNFVMELTVFTFDTGGPFIFGLADASETFKVTLAGDGLASLSFTTLGGVFNYLVGGGAGSGAIFSATVTPETTVPIPQSLVLLGSACAALLGLRRDPARQL